MDDATTGLLEGAAEPEVAEYAELKRMLKAMGLLDQQPGYYACKIGVTVAMLVMGLGLLAFTGNFWLEVADAVFLGFVFGQIGFLGHDAAHRQIARRGWLRDVLCFLHWNLLSGLSYGWWNDKHSRHHSSPNQLGVDPDTKYTAVAFCEEHARTKSGLARLMIRHQAWIFVPMLSLVGIGMRYSSIKYLAVNKPKRRLLDSLLIAAHFCWYFIAVFYFAGVWRGALFITVNQLVVGLYVGATLAANHIGMPLIYDSAPLGGLRQQVVVSRNINTPRLMDFWFGGLNFQIEHHLFPVMARNKMRAAREVVKGFCHSRSIDYYEVGVFHSYREVLRHLHKIGAAVA